MSSTYRRRYVWFKFEEVPDVLAPRGNGGDTEEYLDDPIEAAEKPLRAKILVNPLGRDINDERENYAALIGDQLSEREYLQTLAYRVIDWNVEVPDRDGNLLAVAAPGANPDNPDSVNGWYELSNEQLGWLLHTIKTAHNPKARRPSKPETTPTNGDSIMETAT